MAVASMEREVPALQRVAEIAAAGVLYFALARASLYFASLNASATPIWPPTGLAIALVLMRGNAMLPAIFAGAFAANFMTTPDIATSLAIGVGNTGEALIAALLLTRWADGERVFHSPLGIGKFALVVVVAAAPVSATIGVTALSLTGYAFWGEYWPVWITWWLGDLAGAILTAPALVLWARTVQGHESRRVGLRTLLTLLVAVFVGLLAFSPFSPAPIGIKSALAFLAILPLMWAALRLGLRDTATTALVISSFAVWGVLAQSSPFEAATLNDSLLQLVAFIVAATLPSLALAADRRETQEALDQTRQELAQSQKLEALGQMTGGVAHDFNNLVSAIQSGFGQLARQDEERRRTMDMMEQTLTRGAGLTKQLLAFARREPLQFETLYLSDVVESLEPLLRQSINESIALELRIAPGIWPTRSDRNQLEMAILNLVVNARDAMPNGGRVQIQVENVLTERRECVSLTVADTGAGMSTDVLARAFEPFFSTKGPGAGTGLGLAQVYGLAKQSGGLATIESTPGVGTAVTITLPRA
jgi:signal transduction histidine kinase